PRVSRSSALASKATGFPIAKVAAKLAVGYTLDELQNDITGGITPASFEPSIDYVVTKIPRFTFEKFPQADARLTTQMKSVGEVMAIGRTFQESMQKALRGLEVGADGFDEKLDLNSPSSRETLMRELTVPGAERPWYIGDAFRAGMTVDEVFRLTKVDPWYLVQIEDLIRDEANFKAAGRSGIDRDAIFRLKRKGFSDARLAKLLEMPEIELRKLRHDFGVRPVYKRVDTCAAEFASSTAYMYSTYEEECESAPTNREKIVVIGGGPNRIGQGIEFDYCCVHAALAMREDGYETIMINCNPETVSTDYDTSDRLYFEPITLEDVLEIVHVEKPKGVIVQYGGQTPLKLARGLEAAGVPIIGTSPDAIDRAEDRERFQQMITSLNLLQPQNATVRSHEEGVVAAREIGYPLVVRPSYVLGGRAMEIVYNEEELVRYMRNAVLVSNDSPVLLDHFLNAAIEVDIDAICDGTDVVIGGIMQHIEQAGVHSGDSACSLPPYTLPKAVQDDMREVVRKMALELDVIGLMNVQLAWQDDKIYVIEVNPRASRTVPFVSKAVGVSLAKVAARCMAGTTLKEQGFTTEIVPTYFSVKESVFPFNKFPAVDPILGPEMKSTGEVMGIGDSFDEAFAKAALAAGERLPTTGTAFISVREVDKPGAVSLARDLVASGFKLLATVGTAKVISDEGIPVEAVSKVGEGRPHIVDSIKNGKVQLIINTTEGRKAIADSAQIRQSALQHKVTYTTTLAGGEAFCRAIKFGPERTVRRLQDLHSGK
ncbi:carbamoyl-phosphate synthase large subunit, partial [uncultured Marinobacter sp.]|uniref:carbamoyl-phosphate synthase large subunit n=1 Tax=uncultured Marinobacter sp. TaxID=187379 RepID=UPI0030D8E953